MSDLPRGYTVEPLVRLSDDEIVYQVGLPSWPLTEALFLLSGHKPPKYATARHMQDLSWSAYTHARLAIRQGDICQKTVEAGETIFFDSPANWIAWAVDAGPEYIEVDERVRRALQDRQDGKNSLLPKPPVRPKTPVPPPKKRGGGLKRGRYYGPLKNHLKWRDENKGDLATTSLTELRKDAKCRLITDKVMDIPKSRSTFEEAIKAILIELGVNR